MTFSGFGPKALPFFKALKFHQSREWFEANRETYESAVKGPMGDLVDEVSERLEQAKIPVEGDRKSSASIETSASPPTRTPTRPIQAPS
jgi:uncharacterized protein (DUF2461 family)